MVFGATVPNPQFGRFTTTPKPPVSMEKNRCVTTTAQIIFLN